MKKATVKKIERFMRENHLEMVSLPGDRLEQGSLIQRLPDGTIRLAPMWCHDAIRKMASLPKRLRRDPLDAGSLTPWRSRRRKAADPKPRTKVLHYLGFWELDSLAVSLGLAVVCPDGIIEYPVEDSLPLDYDNGGE